MHTFLLIGKNEYISQILNKLPNKKKLYDLYLYKSLEPLVEYIINNNDTEFKIITCSSNIENIINNVYFDNIDGLIICCDNENNYNNIVNKLDAPEFFYIWFDKIIDNNDGNSHYLFTDNNWENRIFNHIERQFSVPINNQCNIF